MFELNDRDMKNKGGKKKMKKHHGKHSGKK